MASDQPRIGVVGVGHLGQHHVKHLVKMKHILFSGIYDHDRDRAGMIASAHNSKSFDSLPELIKECDGVTVVTPTVDHCKTALQCLQNGKHVFIEKPISDSVESADTLLKAAEENGVFIQVGHIERLNPALVAIKNYELDPKFIEIQRLAPYTSRGTDVPVVLDLMIHDIDILLYFVGSKVKSVAATGLSIMTDSVDIAHARIRFENGTVASLTSSRIAKDKVRKIKIFQKNIVGLKVSEFLFINIKKGTQEYSDLISGLTVILGNPSEIDFLMAEGHLPKRITLPDEKNEMGNQRCGRRRK